MQTKKLAMYEDRIRVTNSEFLYKDTSNMDEETLSTHKQVCSIKAKYNMS